jgi:pimeloyl-ACP methyl ester carboxylesterase
MGYAEYGPRGGTPVVFLPGAGCGRLMSFGEELLDQRRIRLISVDRPGLGTSTPDPDKTFASVGADVARVIEDLAGQPVPLVANSQGAPFGLAVARTGCTTGVVLVSPIDDMAHPPVRASLPQEYRALIDDVAADTGRAFTVLSNTTPAALIDMVLSEYPACDAPVYGDPVFRARYSAALLDGFAYGSEGYVRDTILAMTAWPADLFAAPVPVALLMGADDHAHSPDRAATLAARLGATRTVVEDAGGALLWARPELVFDALDALRPRADSAG